MTEKELNKLIDHEIQWLAYYANRESRGKLTEESNIYKDLVSIGYTKKVIPLDKRCSCGVLTSNEQITKDTLLENIYLTNDARDITKNCYSPLEVYWILYPEKKPEVISLLNNN